MDVLSLLNAPANLEDGDPGNPNATPRLSSQENPVPCPYSPGTSDQRDSHHQPSGTSDFRKHEATRPSVLSPTSSYSEGTSPAGPTIHLRSGIDLGNGRDDVTPSLGTPSDGEGLPLSEMRELDLSREPGMMHVHDDNIRPSHSASATCASWLGHHRFSDSRSSFSSYASSHSEARSRNSSITTIGDDHSIQAILSEAAVTEERRLATVQEETSARWLESHSPLGTRQIDSVFTYDISSAQRSHTKGPVRRPQRSDATLTARGRGAARPWPLTTGSSSHSTSSARGLSHKRARSAPGPRSKTFPGPINRKKELPTSPEYPLNTMTGPGEPPTKDIKPHGSTPTATGPNVHTEPLCDAAEDTDRPTSVPSRKPYPVTPVTPAGSALSTAPRSGEASPQPSPSPPTEDHKERISSSAPRESSGDLKCMFTENCDTGAQLRKAISHFFGRNKSCTLKIPPHVWVHYCRKHYQRIRYRNAKDYGLIQIDLVRTQVEMLQEWSRRNQESGQGRYIKDWALTLRKREQQRLEAAHGPGAALADASSSIPQWVYDSLGAGHTSEQILGMVDRFRTELVDKSLEDIPEIEFLPDIVGGEEETRDKNTKPRKQAKRKASQTDIHESSTGPRETAAAAESLNRNGLSAVSEQGKRTRLSPHDPGLLQSPSLTPSASVVRPPRSVYGSPTYKTSRTEHSRLHHPAAEPLQNLAQSPYYASPETPRTSSALISSGGTAPLWANNQSQCQTFDVPPMRPRELARYHSDPHPYHIREEHGARLPPVGGYDRGEGPREANRHLPPILTGYERGDARAAAGRMSPGSLTSPIERQRYPGGALPHGGRGFANAPSLHAPSLLPTARSAYPPTRLADDPIQWVRPHSSVDHQHRGGEATQVDHKYYMPATLPPPPRHHSDSLGSHHLHEHHRVASTGDIQRAWTPPLADYARPVYHDAMRSSDGPAVSASTTGHYGSPVTGSQPGADRLYQRFQATSAPPLRRMEDVPPVSSGSHGLTASRYTQTDREGSGRGQPRKEESPAILTTAAPNPSIVADVAPTAPIGSSSSGSQRSTPRADNGH